MSRERYVMKDYKIPAGLLVSLFVGCILCACTLQDTTDSQSQQTVTVHAPTQQYAKTSTPNPTPTLSLTPTVKSPPTLTPKPTQTPGPSRTPAPTPVFGAGKVDNDFLFGNQPKGCEIPCWQGLVIGESDAGDIQTTLDMVFGFNGSHDFWENAREAQIPEVISTSYHWDLPATSPRNISPESFHIVISIREDTGLLEAIRFVGISSRFSKYSNPQHILRVLRTPSMINVDISRSEDVREGMATLTMVYERGFVIHYDAIRVQYDDDNIGTLCLGPLPPNITHYWVEAYLTRPIPDSVDDFFPVQKGLFGKFLMKDTPTFQEIFGLSHETLAEMAQQPGDLCITTEVPVIP